MTNKLKKVNVCKNCGNEFYPYRSSKGIYCCNQCLLDYRKKVKYQDYLNHPEKYQGVSKTMAWIKPYILEELNHQCAICGMKDEWNDKPLVFILDHIDGHANNNIRSNLRLICHNCDSQLDTYKSKNKHSDRKYYTQNVRGDWILKEKKEKKEYKCQICGKKCSQGSTICIDCYRKLQREHIPLREELKKLIRQYPNTTLGKMFNVSDNTIKKWCESYNLPHGIYTIRKISDEDWEKI